MSENQFVVFSISNQNYSVNIKDVQEIILFKDAIELPNTPNFVEGIINLRGDVVSVINLANRLKKNSCMDKKSQKIILTAINGLKVGYLVDTVVGIISATENEITPPPAITLNAESKYISGVINKDTEIILIIDVNKILNTNEIIQLEDMVQD